MHSFLLLSLFSIASASSCKDGSCYADGEDVALLQMRGASADSEVVSGGPSGGVSNGMYQNGFDWAALMKMTGPKCNEVCKGEHDQCYPIKKNGYMGPPCGVLSAGKNSPQGCFQNGPTETCALCDINVESNGVRYCCPLAKVKKCKKHKAGWSLAQVEAPGLVEKSEDVWGPSGGVSKGMYQNSFDWAALMKMTGPKCNEVCKGERDQCYPIKKNGYMGPPCGVLSAGRNSRQGCFQNGPTQTCALCDINVESNGVRYCCPLAKVKQCKKHKAGWSLAQVDNQVVESSEVVSAGPSGGVSNGMYQNGFDWAALMKMTGPKCNEVCKGEHDQCYPIKKNGYMGPPCGVLSAGRNSRQGCFQNGPTQTCALCDINVKSNGAHYCCPTKKIKKCKGQRR